jgi:hypothetical protein
LPKGTFPFQEEAEHGLRAEGLTGAGSRSSPPVRERRRRSPGTDKRREQRGWRRKLRLASGASEERFFKNRLWAHQIVYNPYLVHIEQLTIVVQ